jgi:hypothetical protein
VTRVALAAVAAAARLGGCGGGDRGKATLWVTRDEGKTVLLDTTVPAGETALQALDRTTDITTRYGGRLVQSVNGIDGSVRWRHDWFFFVNGIESQRGAQEYRLRDGDVLWWDYRDWGRYGEYVSAVVGAFPEPFVHGFGGDVPPAYVVGPRTETVERVAKLLHARRVAEAPSGGNVLVLEPGATRFSARADGNRVRMTFRGDPALLLDRSFSLRRYRIP